MNRKSVHPMESSRAAAAPITFPVFYFRRAYSAVRQAPGFQFILPILAVVASAGLGLGAAEAIGRSVVDYIAPHSYSVPRNPYHDRFWLAFTQPREHPTDRLVIVITNSQGSLLEGKAEDCYAARLQKLLSATDPSHSYTVANWALPGSNAGELVLLAARAVDHHPDVVIFASFSNNFGAEHTKHPLAFARNDVEQLGYLPSVRSRLSPQFIKHFKVNRRRGKLAAYSSLMNLHESIAFWIRDPRAKEDRDWHRRPHKEAIQSEPVAEAGARMLSEIHTIFVKGLPDTPVIAVNMPLCRTKIVSETWHNTEDFLARARGIFTEPQFTVMDAREIAGPEHFYTATHLDEEGHELFARLLLPEVLNRTAIQKSTDGI